MNEELTYLGRPAPGTCCPEQRLITMPDGDVICKGCDTVWVKVKTIGWETAIEYHHYYKDSGSDEPGAAQIVKVLEEIFPNLKGRGLNGIVQEGK